MRCRFLGPMSALAIAVGAAAASPPAGAQQTQPAPPTRAAQPQPESITPTAKFLNERWAKDDPDTWAKGFESEGRALFDKRFEVVDAIGLTPGMSVADIGAGSGLFSRLIAQRVGPTGTVYAVEISPGLVAHIANTAAAMKLPNVKAVLGGSRSPNIAAGSVDVVFVADTYHHFEHPREMLAEIRKALRPNGLFMLIDFERIEGVSHPFILKDVRAGKATFTKEIIDAGFELIGEVPMFEDEYVLKFRLRPSPQPAPGRR